MIADEIDLERDSAKVQHWRNALCFAQLLTNAAPATHATFSV